MKAKDQAIELVKTFSNVTRPMFKVHTLKVYMHPEHAKQCALICANKILDSIPLINNTTEQTIKRVYYINVIQEINKL
tara:strand:- start:816 stop:1049 length:234 start_codon:yes stop_codon:yes gene_type:complete